MTLVRVVQARPQLGKTITQTGIAGIIAALALTVAGWVFLNDVFRRFEGATVITGEAIVTIETTLEIADEALATLTTSLEAASAATDQASTSAETVSAAIEEASLIIGEDLPATIDAIRAAMPGLIEASAVIDRTLSSLAFFGVPYDPEVPLDEAFISLDEQLGPLPERLRENAATIGLLVPQAEGFRSQSRILSTQVENMRNSVSEARAAINTYRDSTDRVSVAMESTTTGLSRSENIARVLLIIAGIALAMTMYGFVLVGRALTQLEPE
ncbi:MAG TPA: hypothetical protein VFY46_01815 [Acidimicrobiia bacterium]|nr:hypothetical protein [Acidimicrobiia bacterium]